MTNDKDSITIAVQQVDKTAVRVAWSRVAVSIVEALALAACYCVTCWGLCG